MINKQNPRLRIRIILTRRIGSKYRSESRKIFERKFRFQSDFETECSDRIRIRRIIKHGTEFDLLLNIEPDSTYY